MTRTPTGTWYGITVPGDQDVGRLVDPVGTVLSHTWFRNEAEAQAIADQRNLYMLTRPWTPTVANINALPERLRRYITDLQTRSDPAGEIATIHSQREQIEALMRNSPARVARRVPAIPQAIPRRVFLRLSGYHGRSRRQGAVTMDFKDYEELSARTEKPLPTPAARLEHAQLGISSESGEFADIMKRHLIYGKGLDQNHIAEELGDLLWYIAVASRAIEIPMAEIARRNIAKLQERYPEKYTDADALARADKKPGDV